MILLLLLSLFDHPRYNVRGAAQAAFPVCALTVPLLEHVELHGPSLESRRRATLLVDRYYQDNAEVLIGSIDLGEMDGRWPWCWTSYWQTDESGMAKMIYYLALAGAPVAYDHDCYTWKCEEEHWRRATRILVLEHIRCRRPWRPLLQELYKEEQDYQRRQKTR